MSPVPARFATAVQTAPTSVQEQLALLAYQLWQKRGRPEGSPDEDWFRAVQELTATLHMRPREGSPGDLWTPFDRTGEVYELIDAKAYDCSPIGWPGVDWRDAQSELKSTKHN